MKKTKKLKKKVKFSFRRMFVYVATYILCTVMVAGIVVLSASNSYSGSSPILSKPEQSALGQMVNNIMSLKDLSAQISASVSQNGKTVSLDISGDVVLYDGFTGAELNLNAGIEAEEKRFSGNIVYKNGTLYLAGGNANISFKADSAMQGLGAVLAIAGVGNLNGLLDNFDMSLITSLEQKIVEEKLDNGTKLLLAITDSVDVEIYTDSNYNLQKVELLDFKYNDLTINATIVLNKTNSGVIVSEPSNYMDVSPAFTLLRGGVKLATADYLNIKTAVGEFAFDANINLNTQNVVLKGSAFGVNGALYYTQNKMYLDAPIVKLKTDCKDVVELLKEYIADIPEKEAVSFVFGALNSLKEIDLSALGNINFEAITQQGNNICLNLNDVKIDFTIYKDYITRVACTFNGTEYAVNISYNEFEFNLPEYNYINVFDLADFVEPVKNMINGTGISGNLTLNYGEYNLDAKVVVNYNPLQVELYTNILGAEIAVVYSNDTFYLTLNDSKLCTTTQSLTTLAGYICGALGVEKDNLVPSDVLEQVKGLASTLQHYITLVKMDNVYEFMFADVCTVVAINNKLLDFGVSYANASGVFSTTSVNPQISAINSAEYEPVTVTKAGLDEIVNNLKQTAYELDVNLNIAGENADVNIKIDFDGELLVQLSTTLYGYDVVAILQGDELFVNVDENIKITGKLIDLKDVIEMLKQEIANNPNTSTLNADPTSSNDMEKLLNVIGGLDIANIVKNINLSTLNISSTGVSFSAQDLFGNGESIYLAVSYANNKVTAVGVKYNDYNVNVSFDSLAQEIVKVTPEQKEEYVSVNSLAEFVIYGKNTFLSEYITIEGSVNINEQIVDYVVNLHNADDFSVRATLTYKNRSVELVFINSVVYISAYNLKLLVNLNEIESYKDQLFKLLGVTANELDLIGLVGELQEFDAQNALNYISKFAENDGTLKLSLTNGISAQITAQNNRIKSIAISYKDISTCAQLNYTTFEIDVNAQQYENVLNYLDMINHIKDAVLNTFAGEIMFNGFGYNITFNYAADLNAKQIYANSCLNGVEINFHYMEGYLYIEVEEYKLCVAVNDIGAFVEWLQVKYNLDLNIQLPQIDANKLVAIVDGLIKDITLNNGELTAIYNEYVVKLFGNTRFDNLLITTPNFSAGVTIDNTQAHLPSVNTADYNNIAPALNLAKALIMLTEQSYINCDGQFDDVDVSVSLNLNTLNAVANTSMFGVNADLYYTNGKVYVDASALKLVADCDDIAELVISALPNGEAKDVFASMFAILDSTQIDYAGIYQTGNIISIDLVDMMLNFTINNNLITRAACTFNGTEYAVNISYNEFEFNLPEYNYINVFDLADFVEPVKNMINGTGISGNLTLNYGEYNLDAKVVVNYNPLQVELYTNILGAEIAVVYSNDTFYLTLNDSKLCTTTQSLTTLVDYIKDYFDVETNTEISAEDVENIKDAVNALDAYITFIKTDDIYKFMFEGVTTSISVNNNLLDFGVSYANASGVFSTTSINPQISAINSAEYETITITKAGLDEFVNNIKQTAYEANVQVNLLDSVIDISVKIDFTNGLLINLDTTVYDYNVAVVVQGDELYINVDENIKVSGKITELDVIIQKLKDELSNQSQTSALNASANTDDLNNLLDALMNLDVNTILNNINLSSLNVTTRGVSFSADNLLNSGEHIYFAVNYSNNRITALNVGLNDVVLNAQLNEQVTKPVELSAEEKAKYTNISTLADFIIYSKNTYLSEYINLNGYVKVNGVQVAYSVNLYNNPNPVLSGSIEYNERTLNFVYINNLVYLKAYNLKLKCNVSEIANYKDDILTLLGISANALDFSDITNTINEFDMQNALKYLTKFNANDNRLIAQINNEFDVEILGENSKLSALKLTYKNVEVSASATYNYFEVSQPVTAEYVDILSYIDWANNTKNTLMGNISGDITIGVGANVFTLNYIANISQQKAYVYTTILEKQVSVYLQNNCLYVAVDGYKLSFELTQINEFLTWLNTTFNLDVTLNTNISVTNSEIIALVDGLLKDITLTQHEFVGKYMGYTLTLSGETELTNIALVGDGVSANMQVYGTQNNLPSLTVAEYRQWDLTADIISSVYDLVDNTTFNLEMNLVLNENTYKAFAHIDLNSNIIKLNTSISGYELNIIYQNNNIYLDVDGLKLYDSVNNLKETLAYLSQLFNIDLSGSETAFSGLENFNINDIFTTIKINYFGEGENYVNLNVKDVLNLKETLEITDETLVDVKLWHTDGVVNKVDISSMGMQLSVALLEQQEVKPLTEQEINEYTTVISDLNNYTERLINSYQSVKTDKGYAISGDIAVRYSKLKLQGKLTLNVVNDKIYAHISSDAFGVNTNIYLVNNQVYVDVAGLKICISISEQDINYIIDWVNENFNTNIQFKFEGSMLQVKTPALRDVIFDLTENNFGIGITKYVLGGNLNTEFLDLMLNLEFMQDTLGAIDITTNVTDDNTVIYDQGYASDAYDFESEASKKKNLIMRINELAFGAGVDSTVWGFDVNGNITEINGESVVVYNSYDKVLDVVEYALNFYKSGNLDFSADLIVNEQVGETVRPVVALNNGRIYTALTLDDKLAVTDGELYAGGELTEYNYTNPNEEPSVTHSIKAYYDNSYLYASYTHNKKVFDASSSSTVITEQVKTNDQSLNIKIRKNSISEIASIVLHVLNIDLGSFAQKLNIPECDLDVSNFHNLLGIKPNNSGELVSSVDSLLSNISDIVAMVKNINLTVLNNQSTFTISLNVNGQTLVLTINFVDGVLDYISANNIAVGNSRTLDVAITHNVANTAEEPTLEKDFTKLYNTSDEHIDLSDASNLLKALINTSAMNDYYISGKVALTFNIVGLNIDAATIDVGVQVKIVDGKPTAMISIQNMPIITGSLIQLTGINSNGGNGFGSRKRNINIYLRDDIAIIHTSDEEFSSSVPKYDRVTKIPASAIFSNIEYYLQYMMGFGSMIEDPINQSIENGRNRPCGINICNVINSFVQTGNQFDMAINLSELAFSTDIGTMAVSLTTTAIDVLDGEQTKTMDYLHKMAVNIDIMGMINIQNSLTDNPLVLDIGKEVDITPIEAFIKKFATTTMYQEKVSVGGGTYTTTNTASAGVDFVVNGNTISTTGEVGTPISYPGVDVITNTTANGNQFTYNFVSGWYTDAEQTNEFTTINYPRFEKETAYAKWSSYTLVNDYTAATIQYNGTKQLPSLVSYQTTNETTKVITYYNFLGWSLTPGGELLESTNIQPQGTTLYANWNVVEKLPYTFNLYDNNNTLLYTEIVGEGANINIQNFSTQALKYYTDVNCTLAYTGDFTMPDGNLNLYVRKVTLTFSLQTFSGNSGTIKFYQNGSEVGTSLTYYEGEVVDLTQFSATWEYTEGLIFKRNYYYAHLGWSLTTDGSEATEYTVGAQDATIYALWNQTAIKK